MTTRPSCQWINRSCKSAVWCQYTGLQIAAVLQAVTDSVEDSHKTIVEAHTALQQAGRLPTAEAESLRAALQDLWRSEREEFRLEARQFVADAVAHGHNAFESALPDENVNTHRSQKTTGATSVPVSFGIASSTSLQVPCMQSSCSWNSSLRFTVRV